MRKFAAFLVFIFIVFLSTVAGADQIFTSQKIDVLYGNIKIFVDGKELTPATEPFIIAQKGVTMVPVRTLAEALGEQVGWDEKTNSVYIGKKPETAQTPQPDQQNPAAEDVWAEELPVLRNVGPFYRQEVPLRIAGRRFAHGVAADLSTNGAAETVIDINGKFQKMSGYFGVEDKSSESSGGFVLTIYVDDVQLYQSPLIKPGGYPQYFETSTFWGRRATFNLKWQNAGIGSYPEVTAALADLRFTSR